MKVNRIFIIFAFSLIALVRCEYEVTQPAWYKDFTEPPAPSISTVDPTEAGAGYNYITISGENFTGQPTVYFNNVQASITLNTSNLITIHRPNIANDSCVIKVVCDSALVVAKYSPYKVTSVLERYGNFVENTVLTAVAVDSAENLYVVDNIRNIYKVTLAGDKTLLGTASRAVYDASVGPDGRLYLLGNNRSIDVVDPQTGNRDEWIKLPTGKVVKYGDFDRNGYFYSGGRRTGLVVVAPDMTPAATSFHTADEITGIRIFDQYVYLTLICANPDASNPALAIWRHPIGDNGALGDKELVLDLTAYASYSTETTNSFYLSSDGKLFLGTNYETPLLTVDLAENSIDYFYLGILRPYCKYFSWGYGSYIYMICGDTELEEEWTVYRVDLGTTVKSK